LTAASAASTSSTDSVFLPRRFLNVELKLVAKLSNIPEESDRWKGCAEGMTCSTLVARGRRESKVSAPLKRNILITMQNRVLSNG
jgi:hypothetical protein